MSPPSLVVRDAAKSYGDFVALKGISFELLSGELLGFLGPNGAGKTTTIKCIAGRARLDRGSIDYGSVGDFRARLGVVPQTLAIYEDLTVEQNLFAFGRLHGVTGRALQRRVGEALEWANLDDRRRRLAATLSGGMQRRLNIACSVLHDPKVLLLDEPTVGVDPQSRERIYEMLSELRSRGTSILLTTHQLDEAQFRCDRIAIIDQGQIVATGSLDQLVTETIGNDQRIRIHFHEPVSQAPKGMRLNSSRDIGTCELPDVATDLPPLLEAIESECLEIDHMVLQQPTLQDVFLHLTGKELRE